MANKLDPGQTLAPSQSLSGDNGKVTLVMRGDGNFVAYEIRPGADPIVSPVDVEKTLLEGHGIQQDLKHLLERAFGLAIRERHGRSLRKVVGVFPPADVTIESIRDLIACDLPALRSASRLLVPA
jgi:hypothetical protein